MRCRAVGFVVLGLLLGLVADFARSEDISAEQVRKAIDQGVKYLKSQQQRDGSWTGGMNEPGGVTSLCTLALLNSGVPVEDDSIRRALSYLRKLRPKEINRTYSVSLQTMVFCLAQPERDLAAIRLGVEWLEEHQNPDGGWYYTSGTSDNSNSQFALLALYEAERVGQTVKPECWRRAKDYWEDGQHPNGSWGYRQPNSVTPNLPGTGSMTCAGITSMVIVSDMVRKSDARTNGNQIECCQQAESEDDHLQKALAWLGKHFAVTRNPGGSGWLLYYLYGLERVGRLTAHRFIGDHDWYREGADHLLKMRGGLAAAAGWRGVGPEGVNDRVTTAFALLFLSKGRRPILMAKLRHGDEEEWNQHRNDVANLTRYVESRWSRDLVWQVVDLDAATIDDLVQSPVLYYCGRENPLPKSPEAQEQLAQKLRGYIDRNGFLFVEAYSTDAGFDQGFRQLVARMFPEPEYYLQLLPPEHSIWRAEEPIDPAHLRPILGVEFGCRTSVIYCPPEKTRPSLSCLWELSRRGREAEPTPKVQDAIDAGLVTGINVLTYATNRELKFKEPSLPVVKRPGNGSGRRDRLRIAILRHPGGCNAAPRAVGNLLETVADQFDMPVEPQAQLLGITDEALFDYHLVFMHGRNAFSLTDAERDQLKTYIERGGMLFVNSICASRAFTASFRREIQNLFPENPLEPIPPDHPMLSTHYGGFDLLTVTRRDPQSRADGPLRGQLRQGSPELDGVRFDDYYGVVFSRYDLSCALEKANSLECQGYIREDAARIALNVVLYSLKQ